MLGALLSLLEELPESIFHEVAHVSEFGVAFEEFFGLLEDFAIYADALGNPYQAVSHPSFFMRNYYIAVSPCWR